MIKVRYLDALNGGKPSSFVLFLNPSEPKVHCFVLDTLKEELRKKGYVVWTEKLTFWDRLLLAISGESR